MLINAVQLNAGIHSACIAMQTHNWEAHLMLQVRCVSQWHITLSFHAIKIQPIRKPDSRRMFCSIPFPATVCVRQSFSRRKMRARHWWVQLKFDSPVQLLSWISCACLWVRSSLVVLLNIQKGRRKNITGKNKTDEVGDFMMQQRNSTKENCSERQEVCQKQEQ